MDVLTLHQAGLGGVVAVSGTALTEHHARLLARHVERVVLLFDGDEAGRGAVLRSLGALLGEGLAVRVALLEGGEDPDSLVRGGGPQAITRVVDEAASVIEFLFSHCRQSLSKEEARAEALRQLVPLGALLKDRVGRRLFAEEAARRLGFDEGTLAAEIESTRATRMGGSSGRPPAFRTGPFPAGGGAAPGRAAPGSAARLSRRGDGGRAAERMLLAMALSRPRVVRRIRQELVPEDFTVPAHRSLLDLLLAREQRGESIRPADLAGPEADPAVIGLVSALAVDPAADDEREEAVAELVAKLRQRRRQEEITRLRELIREHEAAGRWDEAGSLLERVQSLIRSE